MEVIIQTTIERRAQSYRLLKIRRADKRERLNVIKLKAGCMDCGYAEYAVALDFDHVRGVKRDNPSALVNRSWAYLEEEIAKCEVVCANCHRIRTHHPNR